MIDKKPFTVKLIHCGNVNIANPEDNSQKNIFYIPMGLFPMAHRLKLNDFDIEIIHLDIESENPIEQIIDFDTVDAVGFDCHWINQALTVMETAALFKKIKPQLFVFLGGFSASLFAPEIVADFPAVDAVIRGDGEVPIVELCRVLRENPQDPYPHFGSVRNLTWKDRQGNVTVKNITYCATAGDMEQLDFAPIDLLRNHQTYVRLSRFFTRFHPIDTLPKFLLCIGRGCVYNCSFCGGNAKAQEAMNNRTGQAVRSVESVVATIKKAYTFGYRLFYVCYDFEGSQEWFIRLFEAIKAENIKISFVYGCYSVPSRELIDAASGTFENVMIEISPETADLDSRRQNKDNRLYYSNKDLDECLGYIGTKSNVKVQAFFAYFLPFDTEDTVFSTIELITEIFHKYSHFTDFIYGNLSTDPGSLLFFDPEKYKVDIQVRNFKDYLRVLKENYVTKKGSGAPDMTAFKPAHFTDEEFFHLSGKIRLFNYLILLFSRSVKMLLTGAEDTAIIAEYLKRKQFGNVTDTQLTPEKMKKLLLEISREYIMLTPDFIRTIDEECRDAPRMDFKVRANL
ncbi:MAG: hypothetical protein GY950_02565 [bacterium]|nr:hypothetical protein [bacterium]